MSEVLERDEIESHYKWALDSIYDSDDAWEDDVDAVENLIGQIAEYEGRVDESAETLLEVLEVSERLSRTVSTVGAYARMRWDEDTRRDHYQALASRARTLGARAMSATSFIEPELQRIEPGVIEAWLDEEPALQTYEHYLDDVMRLRPHTRSPEVEGLLADLSDVLGASSEVYTMFHNADLEFPEVEDDAGEPIEITQSNFVTLLKRPDRPFRRAVYEAYFDRWGEFRNTIATTYQYVLERDRKLAAIRDYESALEMHLSGPNVPVEVYDRLVDTVTANLDVLHQHVELKRDVLGVDELRMYDLYAPLGGESDPTITYEEASEYVVDALGLLGGDYQQRVEDGIESRWIDVFENRGKRGGAYSGGTYDTQPFILMNYQDDITSMYTLAHELGHSLHSEYTSEHQPYVYSSYTIFIAEVASTVNEVLLTHHLLEQVDDPVIRRHVIDQELERYRSVLYRQTLFADFERRAHELAAAGEAVTADRLDAVYGERKAAFYEPALVDDRIDREWMRIPHFYRPFYVFQYSTGISAAVAIATDIIDQGESAAERYIDFLSLGSSDYPIDLLRIAGVDMTRADPIEAAIDTYADRLEDFEEMMAEADTR